MEEQKYEPGDWLYHEPWGVFMVIKVDRVKKEYNCEKTNGTDLTCAFSNMNVRKASPHEIAQAKGLRLDMPVKVKIPGLGESIGILIHIPPRGAVTSARVLLTNELDEQKIEVPVSVKHLEPLEEPAKEEDNLPSEITINGQKYRKVED